MIENVLVTGPDVAAVNSQVLRHQADKTFCSIDIGDTLGAGVCQQRRIPPERSPVAAPETVDLPAGQRFPWVPLALTAMEYTAWSEHFEKALCQSIGQRALIGAVSRRVPLGPLHIVNGDEGRLSAHGKAHVPGRQVFVHLSTENFDGRTTDLRCKAW